MFRLLAHAQVGSSNLAMTCPKDQLKRLSLERMSESKHELTLELLRVFVLSTMALLMFLNLSTSTL